MSHPTTTREIDRRAAVSSASVKPLYPQVISLDNAHQLLADGTSALRGASVKCCWIPYGVGICLIFVGIVLSGCVEYQPPPLPMGASKSEVGALIGPPKSTARDGSLTTWNYGGGTVCVFKDDRLVASNISGAPQGGTSLSVGTVFPPVSVNVVPAPYYSTVYAPPPYYGSGWGWGGGGWGYPLGAYYGWGGYYGRPYGYGGNYRRYNYNYYRNNNYYGNKSHGNHRDHDNH